MSWTDGTTRATGDLITAAQWNALLGATGSLMQLKSHAHGGTTGEGSQSLGPLVLADLTTAAAPAAPGAGKGRVYSVTGDVPGWRGGAAGAAKIIAFDPTSAQGDILYRDSSGNLARLAPGTSGHFLKTQGAGADPVWAAPSVAHADTTGQGADDHHNRTEADDTGSGSVSGSVTFGTAFASTPVVVGTQVNAADNVGGAQITARSTTGATVHTKISVADGDSTGVKCVIAQVAT